jgi:hypothetical protein
VIGSVLRCLQGIDWLAEPFRNVYRVADQSAALLNMATDASEAIAQVRSVLCLCTGEAFWRAHELGGA